MRRWLGKCTSALCLAMACAPVFLVLGSGMISPLACVLWPAAAALLAACVASLPAKRRLAAGIVGTVAYGAAGWFFFPHGWGMLLLALCVALYWFVLRRAAMPPFEEWPIPFLLAGAAFYLGGMMLARGMDRPDLLPWLRWLFLAYVPVLLLLGNHAVLLQSISAHSDKRPPRRIQSANAKLAAGIAVAVVLVANARTLRDGFYAVWDWITEIIGRVAAWLLSLLPMETAPMGEESAAGAMDMSGLMAEGEPSAFWLVLQRIAGILAIILLAGALIFALIRLARQLRRFSRWLMERLRLAARQIGEGVQDKTESILDWEEVRAAAKKRVRSLTARLRRPPRWEDLDNRGRVRLTYAQWAKGRAISKASTAREALTAEEDGADLAALYERARYSNFDIDEAEAQRMRQGLRREE